MEEVRSAALSLPRLEAVLLAALGGLALLLAAVGIYGLISHSVTERTREFGIRLALGLSTGQAIAAAARPGVLLTVLGIAMGAGLSWGASGFMRAVIFGVRAGRRAELRRGGRDFTVRGCSGQPASEP